jgi:cytochrome b561
MVRRGVCVDQFGCDNRSVWTLSRRTGLFIVSYVPLAAMFVVLKWPRGWDAPELVRLGIATLAAAALLLLVPVLVTVTGRFARVSALLALAAALVLVIIAAMNGWFEPFALQQSSHQTSAAASALGFGFALLGLMLVGLLLYNAHRAGGVYWTVSNPSEQGAAVAGYLATYLLPLLAIGTGGWRVTAAYGIYLVVLWVVYVRSDELVLINPTLYLFRFRIYNAQVRVDSDPPRMQRVLLLSRLQITDGARVRIKPLGGYNHLALPIE